MRTVLTASYARISSHHLFCHMKTKVRRLTAEFWGCELESEGKSHDQHSRFKLQASSLRAPCVSHISNREHVVSLPANICFHNDALPLGIAANERYLNIVTYIAKTRRAIS